MKCPKCGYNSFDYLDSCKKCNKDLTEHRARFNIQSILLSEMPSETVVAAPEEVIAAVTADTSIDDFASGGAGADANDFGFDFMGDNEDNENLAFDELFEEVSSEDDVEETLPAPETSGDQPVSLDQELGDKKVPPVLEEIGIDDFSFDEMEPDPSIKEDADIFAETEEDFSLEGLDFEDSDKK